MIFYYYLTVQTYGLLNLFFYDESILMTLAAAVGKPITVDSITLDVKRGRFARVCVEIDLDKSVIGKVWLKDYWYHVEYEGLASYMH